MRSTASGGPPRVKQLTRGTTFGILVEPKVKKKKKGRRKTIAACYRTPELIKNREVKQRKKRTTCPRDLGGESCKLFDFLAALLFSSRADSGFDDAH